MTVSNADKLQSRLSRKLSGVKFVVRQRLYRSIKSLSFALLRKLDPDFVLFDRQRDSSGAPRPAVPAVSAINFDKTAIESAVVINNDQAVATPDAVRFYLRGIFKQAEAIELALSQLTGGGMGMTFDEIEAKLDRFLAAAQDSADVRMLSMRSAFYAHRETTAANRRAYSVVGRANPNAVFWPDPTDESNGRSLYSELPFARRIPLIDKSTKIVSAGSCFATEVAHALQRNGYSYVVKEPNKGKPGSYEFLEASELPNSSAAWGIIFNTPSFRQLVEKAFGVRTLPRILWTQQIGGKLRYLDPFRENIAFESPEAYDENYEHHIAAARAALLEMDVFILTLGLNEIWYFKSDGAVFSRSPWRTAPSLVGYKVPSVEENVRDLVRMAEILRAHNPKIRIICTLSPIALHATFRADDQHIITANAHSKAVLRVAAEEFVRRCPETYYFPAYEAVTTSTQHPWTADQRHVSPEAVKNVMALFHQVFSK